MGRPRSSWDRSRRDPRAFRNPRWQGPQSLGTVSLASAAQLKWSCPGCASATFAITYSSSDPAQLAVQAQNTTGGQASVAAGTYTSVTVQATGSWTITITSTNG